MTRRQATAASFAAGLTWLITHAARVGLVLSLLIAAAVGPAVRFAFGRR